MTDPSHTDRCGLCGQPFGDDHGHERPDLTGGIRVEYVVAGIRGALVDCYAVDDPSDKLVQRAADLARSFKIDLAALRPGRKFGYRVIPAEHGRFMVDFHPVPEPQSADGQLS